MYGKKAIIGSVTHQHQKGAEQEKNRMSFRLPALISGPDERKRGPAGNFDIRDSERKKGLQQRPSKNQYKDYFQRIKVNDFAKHGDHDNKGDGSPHPDASIVFFLPAQHVHGKGFHKRDDRRMEYAIAGHNDKHCPKISCEEEENPYCRTYEIAGDEYGSSGLKAVCQSPPYQTEHHHHHRPQSGQNADLEAGEVKMIAV